jgi:hypothetical protein
VTDKKIAKSNLVSRRVKKNFGVARGHQYGNLFSAPYLEFQRAVTNQGFRRINSKMVQCFEMVEVTTDDLLRGLPRKQLWRLPSEQAIAPVLGVVPEGWTAVLTDGQLKADQIALLNLMPASFVN